MRPWIFGIVMFLLGWLLSWYFHHPVDSYTESAQNSGVPPSPRVQSQQPGGLHEDSRASALPTTSLAKTPSKTPAAASVGIPTPSTVERVQAYLAHRQYAEFFSLFQDALSSGDDTTLRLLREVVYGRAEQLQQQKRPTDAASLLQQLLAIDYDNVHARLLLATVHHQSDNFLVAIEQLYIARSYAQEAGTVEQITRHIRRWVTELTRQYNKEKRYLPLIDLYRELSEKEPEYAPHHIGLAEAYLALGNKADAKHALDLASFDVEVSAQIQRLQARIQQEDSVALTNATGIPLRQYGNHYVIKVLLNGALEASLMLDTGATLSIITPNVRSALGANVADGAAWFNTANGVVESVLLNVDSISAGPKVVQGAKVGVLELSSGPHIDGLLGMDFLKHFKFYIDQEKHILYLQ